MDITMLLMLAVLGAAFYFMIIRPQKKRQQDQQKMVDALRPGTRIMTTAGVFGTIVERGDEEVRLEIAPGVVIAILPAAVGRVVTPVVDEPAAENPEA